LFTIVQFRRAILLTLLLLAGSAMYAASLPEQFFGMNILHAINKTPWPNAKVASIRLWDTDDTSWSDLQSARGKFNWDGLDRWLKLAERNHADVIYTFGRVPKWANDGKGQSLPPTDLNAWDDFVRAIVRHAKGRITAWELWNEPNDPNFWTGDINTLLEMGRRAQRIIKQEQPNAIVLTPSATWHQTSPSQWFEQYFSAGGGKFEDVIAFHGYVGTSPEAITSELQRIRDVASRYGVNKPLWDTESSWGTDAKLSDPNAQASFLARSYILHVSQGVHRFYWYAWDGSDGGQTSSDKSWGTLWNAKNGVLPAGLAYKTVHGWLSSAPLPLLCNANNSVWQCKLGDSSLIVWNSSTQQNLQLDPHYTRYFDLGGNTHPVPANHIVAIGPAPILIRSN
jgi:polysaccharide biosynthesis protein PslG